MKITNMQITVMDNSQSKMIGLAGIVLDDMIAIHEIKIIKNEGRIFLAMPSKKLSNSRFVDIVHPINADVRAAIENIVISVFEDTAKTNYYSVRVKMNTNPEDDVTTQNANDYEIVSFFEKTERVEKMPENGYDYWVDEE